MWAISVRFLLIWVFNSNFLEFADRLIYFLDGQNYALAIEKIALINDWRHLLPPWTYRLDVRGKENEDPAVKGSRPPARTVRNIIHLIWVSNAQYVSHHDQFLAVRQTAASKRCFQYIQNYKNFSNLIRPWYQQASWALIGQFACCACEKVDFHCRTVFFLCVRT